jgi:hypothetical protein
LEKGDVVARYEVCAVCIGKKEIYGCVKWAYDIIDRKLNPVGGGETDLSATPSKDWELSVCKWNDYANKQPKDQQYQTFPL